MIRFWSHSTANFSDTHYQWKIVCKSPASRWLFWCSMSAYHVRPQVGFYRMTGIFQEDIVQWSSVINFTALNISAGENSWHFMMPLLVSPRNDIWGLNKCRNSILMTCYYPDLGSTSDWLKQISLAAWPMRSTSQIKVVTSHQ